MRQVVGGPTRVGSGGARDYGPFLCSTPREANDLAQETYLRALRSLPEFADQSSFGAR
ncbi:MAG: sigma factor [Pseudonocardia sp.]